MAKGAPKPKPASLTEVPTLQQPAGRRADAPAGSEIGAPWNGSRRNEAFESEGSREGPKSP